MSVNRDLRVEADRLKATVSITELIAETLPLKRNGRYMTGLCPFHGEKTPSFHVYEDHYHCFGCGAHGDVFAWLMTTRRMSFPEAVRRLGGGARRDPPHDAPSLPKPPTRKQSQTATAFLHVWDQGVDPAGTIVEPYLRSRRGLSVPDGAPIRFHPHCQRGARDLAGGPEYWPAMLCLMTDPMTGKPVGLHRTYLLPDGSGKTPTTIRGGTILKPKMIIGTWGLVRLTPDENFGRALAIAEGVETALTISQIIRWGPTWAAGTQDGIRNLPLLPWIEALTIFPDADDTGVGLAAALACAARWRDDDREVIIQKPPLGEDWNDAVARLAP